MNEFLCYNVLIFYKYFVLYIFCTFSNFVLNNINLIFVCDHDPKTFQLFDKDSQ